MLVFFGVASGREFSPDQFDRRRFTFLQLPLVRAQITPVRRKPVANDLDRHLKSSGLVVVKQKAARWDVAQLDGPLGPRYGDANILWSYLEMSDVERNLVWLTWTKKHPTQAKLLWPAVQEMAQANAYVVVPQLFELAAEAGSDDAFGRRLQCLLAQQYASLGDNYRALEDHRTAVGYYDLSLTHDASNADTLRARAASLSALLGTLTV